MSENQSLAGPYGSSLIGTGARAHTLVALGGAKARPGLCPLRLNSALAPPLQLLACLSECLSLDPLSFSVWRQLYTKHLLQSRYGEAGAPSPRGLAASFSSCLLYIPWDLAGDS